MGSLGAMEREELLAASEGSPELRRLAEVLDLMPIGVVLVEPGTARVLYANKAADDLAGGDFPRAAEAAEYSAAYPLTDRDGKPLDSDAYPGVRAARGEALEGVEVDWHTPGGVRSMLVSSLAVPTVID